MIDPPPVYPVSGAEGVRLKLADGRTLVDGMTSWWAAIHGYNHLRLNHALQAQLARMAHVMFGGLTHAPAIDLAQRLVAITPAGLEKVFLCDSGSVAVEVAVKMAIQYWQARGRPGKRRLLALRGGRHFRRHVGVRPRSPACTTCSRASSRNSCSRPGRAAATTRPGIRPMSLNWRA